MLNTNITKITAFVIFAIAAAGYLSACHDGFFGRSGQVTTDDAAPYGPPVVSGHLQSPDLNEASGLAASKCRADVYWTHNDSGSGAFLFAIDGTGAHLGVWQVTGAANKDWEDIASFKDDSGKCFVLVGDIGNNELERQTLSVYRIPEPSFEKAAGTSNIEHPLQAGPAEVLSFSYADRRHNAEALLVLPVSGEIYLLTKSDRNPSIVFRLKPIFNAGPQVAEHVGEITVPAIPNGLITGADISSDGRRIVLCDYFSAYELELPSDSGENFDIIWLQKPKRFDIGKREIGEAVAYTADDGAVMAVSEKKYTPVMIARRP